MKVIFSVCLLLLMVGCVSQPVYRARLEYGYGGSVLLGDWVNHQGTGQSVDIHNVSAKIIIPVAESKNVRFDLPLGPYVVFPQRYERLNVYGGEIAPRLVYTGWEKCSPYFEWIGGANTTSNSRHWKGEGSSFDFNTGGGVGTLIPVSSKIDLSVGYRYWHLSNAGTSYPNPGYNVDMALLGIEYKF